MVAPILLMQIGTNCALSGRGASEKPSAVGFCLGSGLFGSYNSD